MTITVKDPIVAPPRCTAADVERWYVTTYDRPVPTAVHTYLVELDRLCRLVGFDTLLLAAQSAHETDGWQSFWWRTRLNPAGIGITGDTAQNAESPTFATGKAAALAQVTHMRAYVAGHASYDAEDEFRQADPRYDAVLDAGFAGTVKVLGDLGNGRWAADPDYAALIARRANEIARFAKEEPQMPDLNMTKGLIPLPAIDDDIVDVSRRSQSDACRGYDNLGPRPEIPKFLVLHRAQMAPEGSNSGYFHSTCCPALTDLEVNCVTGKMKRFVGRGNAPSGWANGRVSGPYGDALAWLELHGWDLNTVNRDGEACEITGWFLQPGEPSHEDPVADVCWGALAQWIASRAHDYGITWLDFPLIPSENGRSYVTWHQEWTIGTGKVCPSMTVMHGTPALIERARAIMRAAQTGTKPSKPPSYAASELPDWWAESLSRSHPSDVVNEHGRWWVQRRNFECVKFATARRAKPDIKAPISGPSVIAGEKIWAERLLEAERDWLVTTDGHYLIASAFTPNVSLKSRKAKAT